MPAIVHWKDNTPHLKSASINVDEVGVVQFSSVYLCKDDTMAKRVLRYDASDMEISLPRPWFMGSSADRMEAGMWQVTVNFSAILSEDLIGNYKLYKLSTITNKEPIQTHPKFNTFAGKFGASINGAVFDAEGFVSFKPFLNNGENMTVNGVVTAVSGGPIKNIKSGVTDYLMPIVHLEETALVLESDLSNEIQYLSLVDPNVPQTPLKPRYRNRNWLLTQADPEWAADGVYKLVRKWSLSGPRGWDKDTYPST